MFFFSNSAGSLNLNGEMMIYISKLPDDCKTQLKPLISSISLVINRPNLEFLAWFRLFLFLIG